MQNSNKSFIAKIALLLATIIWGSTFFIMEGTIQSIGIYSLLAFRFTLAAIILAVILIKHLKVIDKGYLWRGFVMGALVIVAYIFQTYGLADEATTPGKNAFLTAIYCVIVPFLAYPFTKIKPDRYNVAASFLCIFGITLISVTGGDFSTICRGDLLTLLGGIFFSLHMIAVSVFSQGRNILLLTMLQFFFAGLIAWIPALMFETFPSDMPLSGIGAILYLTIFATCLCYLFQNAGQKFTTPSTAALILSLEAVFGVLFSVIFTAETVSFKMFIGFSLVFLAIIVSELKPFKSKRG
ncbi:MAG: DMT family transporter [Clostridia bacterium]|nr:DMT family transporter [Clostridia bacterium]